MVARIQSPSSISAFKQCPRKYYYYYVAKLPTKPNIFQVRGNIAHSVLEKFFDIDVSKLTVESFELELMQVMQELLLKEWKANESRLNKLDLKSHQKAFYFEDTMLMLINWLNFFMRRIYKQEGSFQERFKKLTPLREHMIVNQALSAKGIIDAIENIDGETRIMDYKTSNHSDEEEYRLQLAIYTLLYSEKHGKLPDKAGIYFLKDRPKFIDVDEGLLELARREIVSIHKNTESTQIHDYPRSPSRLCKWSTGQCEFFGICRPFDSNPQENYIPDEKLANSLRN